MIVDTALSTSLAFDTFDIAFLIVSASFESSLWRSSRVFFVFESDTGGEPSALTSSLKVWVADFAVSRPWLRLSLLMFPPLRVSPSEVSEVM